MSSEPQRPFVHRYPPQHLIYGPGSAGALGGVLAGIGIQRGLLLCGANLNAAPGVVSGLVAGAEGRIASVWAGVRPHAPFETVDAAAEAYRALGADGLISLGGGSAHDTMRAVSLLLQAGGTIADQFKDPTKAYARADPRPDVRRIPMAAIPTTLSAAETTFGGGVTHQGRKYVFVGDTLFIDRIVVDTDLFATTPREVLVDTGFNAINHAIERIVSPSHQPIGDAAFLHALRLLMPALQVIGSDAPLDEPVLTDAALGAHLSESTNVLGGIGHAIAHVLGGRYRVPHGTAHGLGMIPGLRLAGPRHPAGIVRIHDVLRDVGCLAAGDTALDAVIASFQGFLARLGRPARLRDIGIAEADLAAIARDVMGDFSVASSGRADLNETRVGELLREIW